MKALIFACTLLMIFPFFSFQNKEKKKKKNKKLVWSDEFNYSGSPSPEKWDYEIGYVRNGEMQYYTKRNENIRVEDGNLVIEARNDSAKINNQIAPVTSASLISLNKASWKYGCVEVKAKIPISLGTWPAIWMLGTNINEVGWPKCGEIDIMEHVGYDPALVHTTIHTKSYNHSIGTGKGASTPLTAPDEFHLYAVEWTNEKIDFFFDKKLVHTFTNDKTGVDAWPFDQPFYLIMNLAIGGGWGGVKGVDLNSLPKKFYVDYVRVYEWE
jgi:beta-glucanase (GH16 family)